MSRGKDYYWLHDSDVFALLNRVHASARLTTGKNFFENFDEFLQELHDVVSNERMYLATRNDATLKTSVVMSRVLTKCPIGANTRANVDTVRAIIQNHETMTRNINSLKAYQVSVRYQVAKVRNECETLLLEQRRLRAILRTDEIITSTSRTSDRNEIFSCKRRRT